MGVYISMRFFVPIFLPFLFAFTIVLLLNPIITKLHKRIHVGKGMLMATVVFLLVFILGALVCFLGGRVLGNMGKWISGITALIQDLSVFVSDCCFFLEAKWGIDADRMEQYVLENVNFLAENIEVTFMPRVMGESIGYAKNIASFAAGTAVMIIAVILLAKDYDQIKESINKQKWFSQIRDVVKKMGHLCRIYLKAQLIIMSVIVVISALGLWGLGVGNPLGFGLLTGVLDVLPFIGTGIVLVPFTIYFLITGEFFKAAGAVLLYVVCSFTREFLEPKLIGEKVGIFPIAILISVYVGIKLYGVQGIVLGPLSMVLILEIFKHLQGSWAMEAADRAGAKETNSIK